MHAPIQAISEILWQFADLHTFVYYVTACLVVAVCWFIREIVGTAGLALISAPILMVTGLGAHIAFGRAAIQLTAEKDTNVAMTSAVGVLAGLVLVVSVKWLMTLWKEYRVRHTRLSGIARPAR